MEMFCFGIFAGMILAVIFIAGGAVYAKGNTQRSNDVDSDCRVYVPCRDRDRSGNQSVLERMDAESAKETLETMRMAAKYSDTERDAIDYSMECIDIAHKLAKYFKGETE